MQGLFYRREMTVRPRTIRDKEAFCIMPTRLVERKAEEVLILRFILDRKLFGLAYCELQPEYFDAMPQDSGVFVAPLVRTSDLISFAQKPGDIDLLVLPYEKNELVLDRILAIEVKAIRAKFLRPGKSPNEFGFSQASSLLDLGFPYVAVAHLIISDISPEAHWNEMYSAEVLNREGSIRLLGPTKVDPLPDILTDRSFGRLKNNCRVPGMGLLSAYLFSPLFENIEPGRHMIHFPSGSPAQFNSRVDIRTLNAVASYFENNASTFLDNPRYDPI